MNNRSLFFHLAALLLGLTLACGKAHGAGANLLADGDFEAFAGRVANGSYTPVYAGDTVGAWKVGGNSVDLIRNAYGAINSISIDMNGWDAGSLSQTFQAQQGVTYTLKFDYNRNGGGTMNVTFGGTTTSYSTPSQPTTVQRVWTAPSSGLQTVTFASTSGGSGGLVLDNVVLTGMTAKAEYLFEQSSYNGTSGEILDTSGNGFGGRRLGSAASTASGRICRALVVPLNQDNTADGMETGINVATQLGDAGTISFWYKANTAWDARAATLFDATASNTLPFYLMRTSAGLLKFIVTDSDGDSITLTAPNTSVGAANTWYHIAVSWYIRPGNDKTRLSMYINGALVANDVYKTKGNIQSNLANLSFGDHQGTTATQGGTQNSADGVIDQIRIHDFETSAADISADASEAQPSSCAVTATVDHIEVVPDTMSPNTCQPLKFTVRACANASCSSLMTGYTGSVLVSVSSSRGNPSPGNDPAPSGTGVYNAGGFTYTFVAGDGGKARFQMSNALAQQLTMTGYDQAAQAATSRTTGTITFSDNSLLLEEDTGNLLAGTGIAVAGRPHDMTVSYMRRDPATGFCGVMTEYGGNRALKLWRTDQGGSWTPPTVVSPTLTLPTSKPGSSNLTLAFTNGVARFNLGTTDVGRYVLGIADDTPWDGTGTLNPGSVNLTVRPFALLINQIKAGAVNNPNGANADATNSKFAIAGADFSATIRAYRWSAGADSDNDGMPDPGATEAQLTAGGALSGFNSAVTLSPVAGSQTPASGVMGTLSNGVVASSAFTSGAVVGQAIVSNLQYSEVGSFLLNTSGVVGDFLGSGLALNAFVTNSSGAQNNRIGRFVPAGFVLSNPALTARSDAACSPASSFTYLGENFQLAYTLTAVNLQGGTTLNYRNGGTSATNFARLSLTGLLNLAGIDASAATAFPNSQINIASQAGTWGNGVSSGASVVANVSKASNPGGPYSVSIGMAPVDADGVGMKTFDLDTSLPADTADHSKLAVVPLRYGRLRLQNSIGSNQRPLSLPLLAQYWNGQGYTVNTADSCSRILSAHISLGNYRKSLNAGNTGLVGSAWPLVNGTARLTLAAPTGGSYGSLDVALMLGSADSSCLAPWTPGKAASSGANLQFMRSPWCAATDKDPSARASFGLYGDNNAMIYQRQNF